MCGCFSAFHDIIIQYGMNLNEYIYDKGRVFMEKSKLVLNTLAKFFAGIILVAVLLFLPAGTLH